MDRLIDANQRQRFVEEIDQPFSVIAPAGVGKTHSIIERVAAMLERGNDPVALVTYTKKAAEQMRRRLETRLKKDRAKILPERIFIGTIHSLCAELMDRHAIRWELPATREIFSNAQYLWNLYREEVADPFASQDPAIRERYIRYFGDLGLGLLLQVRTSSSRPVFSTPPVIDFQKILQAEVKGPQKKAHERLKKWTSDFLELVQMSGFVMPELPKAPDADSPFKPFYDSIFGEFINWRAAEGMRYAQFLAQSFRAWRRSRGVYLYDDLVEIVSERAADVSRLSIVLDEAQDTSPAQLSLLKSLCIEREGRLQFTMVGDPQQSIYSSRASLPDYLSMHRELVAVHAAQELTFRVTFRCAQKVVEWANLLGPQLLPGGTSQAQFVELFARPHASEGHVARWQMDAPAIDEDAGVDERDWIFAEAFAKKFKALELNPSELHHIAILAPRKEWLFKLAEKLISQGLRVQLHAQASSATPAERLLRATLHLMLYPFDSFELVGYLRELSACDDLVLARAAQQTPEVLTLLTAPDAQKLSPELFQALEELYRAREAGKNLALDQALAIFIREARLDEKIAALDVAYRGTLIPAWQQEKMRVLAMASSGKTAATLLQELDGDSLDAPLEPGALQLMTMHKAKGLEWQTVFLPFLHRPIHLKPPRYPAADPANPQTRLSWKISTQISAAPEIENFRRLLYVALTRAKEDLILVDDAAFYPPEFSMAQLLGISAGEGFHNAFQTLSTAPNIQLLAETIEVLPEPQGDVWQMRSPVLPVITPSGLPTEDAEEKEIVPAVPTAEKSGVNYGEVWHALWHRVFTREHTNLEETFLTHARESAFFSRAQKEFELLKKSALWSSLLGSHIKHTEVPFIVKLENAVMEGRADMIIERPEGILVIDWKTDHLPPEELARTYQAQVHAYQTALSQLFKRPVEAKIYSTVHGVLL